jgi:hypothetical protein
MRPLECCFWRPKVTRKKWSPAAALLASSHELGLSSPSTPQELGSELKLPTGPAPVPVRESARTPVLLTAGGRHTYMVRECLLRRRSSPSNSSRDVERRIEIGQSVARFRWKANSLLRRCDSGSCGERTVPDSSSIPYLGWHSSRRPWPWKRMAISEE